MPSVSQAQLNLFRKVYNFKKGNLKNASARIRKIAKKLTMKQVEDFLKPSKKKLPKRIGK